MKIIFILIFFLITATSYSQIRADNTIEIKYIRSLIRTAAVVEPIKFDSAFASGLYTDTLIHNPELFAKLWNSYKDISYSKVIKTIDTRYKITLYFSVYTPPLIIYMNAYFDSFDEKGLIAKGPFLKTLHHLVDAIMYQKKI